MCMTKIKKLLCKSHDHSNLLGHYAILVYIIVKLYVMIGRYPYIDDGYMQKYNNYCAY